MDNPSIDAINSRLSLIEYKYILILTSVFVAFSLALFVIIMVYCCLKRRNSYKSSQDHNSPHKIQEICIIPITKPAINESKPQLNLDTKIKAKTLIERRGSNNSLTLTIDPIKKNSKFSIGIPPIECPTNNENLYKNSNLLDLNELIRLSKQYNVLCDEFCNIPTNYPETIQVYGSAIKNRYKTILPNESTRVRLPLRNNDPLSVYINANYLNGYNNEAKEFIATQGPMSNTINDFWCMIWNDCVTYVVMITKLKEKTKSKCELYIPENLNECVNYGDISVCVVNISYENDYEVRQINIMCNNETRTIYHYWYTTWPDQSVPSNPDSLIQLIKQIEANRKKCDDNNDLMKYKAPILVHCSAGIGRTGCFIAISLGMQQIDSENMVDILRIVNTMRQQRGGMIQTLEQYEFVYQALAYYCIYYKNYSRSPKLTPPSSCLQTFTFNTQTIQ